MKTKMSGKKIAEEESHDPIAWAKELTGEMLDTKKNQQMIEGLARTVLHTTQDYFLHTMLPETCWLVKECKKKQPKWKLFAEDNYLQWNLRSDVLMENQKIALQNIVALRNEEVKLLQETIKDLRGTRRDWCHLRD